MSVRWFVMLNQGNGTPAPLVDEKEGVALFDDEEAADEAGFANPLGGAFGFATCEWTFTDDAEHLRRSVAKYRGESE